MDRLPDLLTPMFGDSTPAIMVGVLVFLAAATLAFGVMAVFRVQGAVKRRAAGIAARRPAGTKSPGGRGRCGIRA